MTSPDFLITVSGTDGHQVIEASGELDYRTGLALTERAYAILCDQPSSLSLDLSAVSFFASGTISALVAIQQAAAKTHTDLDLRNVPPSLRRLLELSGVVHLFRIEPPAADAGVGPSAPET